LKFIDFNLSDPLMDGLDAMGFETATPIQEKAIPVILAGKDLIGCAQTGTGKTAAFLLPVLNKLTSEQQKSNSVNTLILVPTRELAIQIDRQLEGFAYFTGTSSMAIYGGRDGESFAQEKKAFSMGADIIVATPGRLIAHLNLGYVKLGGLKHLILDEADRMLDMGFVSDIEKISSFLPKDRQTLLFSATMPTKIRKLASTLLNDPEQITFKVSQPAAGILQAAYEVEDDQKLPLLKHKLKDRKDKEGQIIVFASTKLKVKAIASNLKRIGLNVNEMHSDFDQDHREQVISDFRANRLKILVATDILSRGIDVKGIALVINYDVPPDPEDYIHRIGRTARADSEGVAITLINSKDRRKFGNIERMMKKEVKKLKIPAEIAGQREEAPGSRPQNRRSGGGGRGRNDRSSGGGNRRGGAGFSR
jgi:ATP-dependent RNA helicase RhlE